MKGRRDYGQAEQFDIAEGIDPIIMRRMSMSTLKGTDTAQTVKATLTVVATVVAVVAGIVSIWAFFAGGPEAVATTWRVIVQAPQAIANDIKVNVNLDPVVAEIAKITAKLDSLERAVQTFCQREYGGEC